MRNVPRRTIAVVGDLILAKAVNAEAASRGPKALLADLHPLRDADLAIANLECVATAAGTRHEKRNPVPVHFRSRPETLAVLAAAGIDAVTTANNHVGDYGPLAILEQAAYLDGMGIAHPGSGSTSHGASAPAFLDAGGGIAVALFSVDTTEPDYAARRGRPGTCYVPIDDHDTWSRTFRAAIARARRQAHVVLFAVHWGDDWAGQPSREKRSLGRLLIDMGVDAVLGTNAHVLQGIEQYAGGVIINDLGHVLTPFDRSSPSAVFTLRVGGGGVSAVEVHPIVVEARGRGARMASAEERAAGLDRLAELSAQLGTELRDGVVRLPHGRKRAAPSVSSAPSATIAFPGVPRPAAAPPPGCLVPAVPAAAEIEPLAFGPLRLIGLSLPRGRYIGPEPVDVDLYWTASAPIGADLRILVRGRPDGPRSEWLSEHEPCDWAWPTSRWVPGQIYHDRVQLRPPPDARSIAGAASVIAGIWDPIDLSVSVIKGSDEVASSGTVHRVRLGIANALLVGALLLALLSAILLDV
jgi:hypothetical protein